MSGLLKAFATEERNLLSGEVLAQVGPLKYQVRASGHLLTVHTATEMSLSKGSKVVLAKTENGYFVVGREELASRSIVEVQVEG